MASARRNPVERAVAGLAAFGRVMADCSPRGSTQEVGGATSIRTGLPVHAFNGVWGFAADVRSRDVLDAVDTFRDEPLPWNVQLRPGYPADLDAALAARGLVARGQIPLMVLGEVSSPPARSDVALRQLVSYGDLDSFLSLVERGFGVPGELSRSVTPIATIFATGSSTWLLRHDGTDVSTATSFVSDAACGIYNVATPQEHRGRGFAGLVTAATVRHGRAAGANLAYLQSTPAGYRVYERLGFVTVERWTQWLPREHVPGGATG